MLSCLTALFAVAQETAEIDNIKYYLYNGEATVMKQTETLSGDITIPETVTYNNIEYKVVRIAESAFTQQNVTNITLPNSVIELGEGCFSGCTRLKTVTLPKKITKLPNACFVGCYNLESLTLPEGITELGDGCFNICENIVSITLPKSVTKLGEACFAVCSSLESITLPEGVTEIKDNCFSSCSSLKSITLPEGVTEIKDGCFSGCSSLESITLPEGIKLGNRCFLDCSSLKSITLPKGVTELRDACFSGCSNLESITLPEGITELKEGCFSGCSNLESIILPSSINLLGSYCFSNCSSLLSVTCQWKNLDSISAAADAFDGIFSESKLNVPAGTTAIYQNTEPWSNFKYIVEDGSVKPAEKCATPEISYEEKQIIFTCPTEGAQYHYTITAADATEGGYSEDGIIDLTAAYEISVYASAAGYTNSDVATGTLYFTNAEDITVNVAAIDGDQRGLLVTTRGGLMTVSGLADGETVTLYNAQGMMIASGKATAGSVSLDTNGTKGVVILKAGNESLKVNIK